MMNLPFAPKILQARRSYVFLNFPLEQLLVSPRQYTAESQWNAYKADDMVLFMTAHHVKGVLRGADIGFCEGHMKAHV